MPIDVNPAHFAGDPAFTDGLVSNPAFMANLLADPTFLAFLDARFAPIVQGRVVATAQIGGDQTGIGASPTPLTGFSLTFTAVAARRYLLQWVLQASQQTASAHRRFDWALGGAAQSIIAYDTTTGFGSSIPHSGFADLGVLGAGSKTVTITGQTSAGTLTIHNGSFNNGRMTILDVGI